MGRRGGRCPHTLPIESTGQLDTHLVPRPSKHTQGLHTPLLAGHKGVPPPPSERSTKSRHTSKSLTHTPLNSKWGFSWTHLHSHTPLDTFRVSTHTPLLAGHKGVPPPPSERSTGSRHTSKSLTHTPLNSLGQVGVQLDTPPLPHPSGHTPSLHTPMSRSRESQEGCSPTTLFPSFYRQDSDSVGWTGSHFSAQILG